MSEDDVSSDQSVELRSYGRRRGRKLSPRQERLMAELLPAVSPGLAEPAPSHLLETFDRPLRELWLEIGFGGGEHLLWQARAHPDVGLIGAEPFEDGIVKVLTAIEDEGLGNILVHGDDVRGLLRWLPDGSLSRVFILFPDPWPKKRHVKRRLINGHLVAMLARVLKSGGELRIATDIGDYARTILMALGGEARFHWTANRPADWRVRPDDWPATRYEAKAFREGRRCCYLTFVRRG